MPGLHSKYYDQDMEPLVEVVQDTCGRHDAFALACAAKYYDDIGYPGHVNCSENFNSALADKGVTPRAGWMAINFFFNTAIDAQWRDGFRRALVAARRLCAAAGLTDIVCVSSACPDDTTPANGWNLTDIHVRTYTGAAKILPSHSQTNDPRRRAQHDPRDRLPFELCQAHAQFRRVQGLLAGQLLRQGRADRGILGLPREGGGHGPLAAQEVRGDRAGFRGAAAIHADARREEARRRPGRLFGHVLRAWRHDRRRHAAPARQGQFPLDRRRRLSADLAARDGGKARAEGAWCAHRPTRCTTSPCRGRRAATY